MIKSIFDSDEEPTNNSVAEKQENETSIRRELEQMNRARETTKLDPDVEREVRRVFSKIVDLPKDETPPPAEDFRPTEPPPAETNRDRGTTRLDAEFLPKEDFTDNSISREYPFDGFDNDLLTLPPDENADAEPTTRVFEPKAPHVSESPISFNHEPQPLSAAETIRQSGLAWSAAIGLFASVLFMLIIGWIFDVLTGASPIGLVVGIIIGAGIGFYQFFRVTSQIFKK